MFRKGQKVRLVEDVDTWFRDSRFEYPGIDYEEFAALHEPLRLLAGTVARFEAYVTIVKSLWIATWTQSETDVSNLLLGRNRVYLVEVPSRSLELCTTDEETTLLSACAASLRADHLFLTDV